MIGDGFGLRRVERKQILIFQQHKGFFGNLEGNFLMCSCAQQGWRRGICGWRRRWIVNQIQFKHHVEMPAHFIVQNGHGEFAGLQPFQKRIGQIILVVVLPGPHFDVHAIECCQIGVMHTAPVGNDGAFEPPFMLENFIQQTFVLAAMLAVDLVVSSHDGHHARLLYRSAKCRQINLAQCAFVYDFIDRAALIFLAVRGEMFDTG